MTGMGFTDDDIDAAMQQMAAVEAISNPQGDLFNTGGEDLGAMVSMYVYGKGYVLTPAAAEAVDNLSRQDARALLARLEKTVAGTFGKLHVLLDEKELFALEPTTFKDGCAWVGLSQAA